MEGDEAGRAGSVSTVTSLSPPRTISHRRRKNAQSIKARLSDSRRSRIKELHGNYGDSGRTLNLRLWVVEGDFKAVTPIQRPANRDAGHRDDITVPG